MRWEPTSDRTQPRGCAPGAASGEETALHGDDQENPERGAVDHERPGGETLEEAHQNAGYRDTEQQMAPGLSRDLRVVQHPQFLQSRQGNRRQTEQERKTRRLFTLEVEEQRTTEIYTLSLHDALPIWAIPTINASRRRISPTTR